jgi:hypothetical protein
LPSNQKVEILEGELLTPRAAEGHSSALVVAEGEAHGKRSGSRPGSATRTSSALTPFGDLPWQPEALTTQRRALMMLGRHPPELYQVGLTAEETQLRMRLSLPDPPHGELAARLQALDPSFTDMKTHDLLRELPSKPLLALYVKNKGARADDLVRDLMAHFRLVRRTDEIAATLKCVVATDVEAGAMQAGSDGMRQQQDSLLQVRGFMLLSTNYL